MTEQELEQARRAWGETVNALMCCAEVQYLQYADQWLAEVPGQAFRYWAIGGTDIEARERLFLTIVKDFALRKGGAR